MVLLGDIFPNFHVHTNEGEIDFHDFVGDQYVNSLKITI